MRDGREDGWDPKVKVKDEEGREGREVSTMRREGRTRRGATMSGGTCWRAREAVYARVWKKEVEE